MVSEWNGRGCSECTEETGERGKRVEVVQREDQTAIINGQEKGDGRGGGVGSPVSPAWPGGSGQEKSIPGES